MPAPAGNHDQNAANGVRRPLPCEVCGCPVFRPGGSGPADRVILLSVPVFKLKTEEADIRDLLDQVGTPIRCVVSPDVLRYESRVAVLLGFLGVGYVWGASWLSRKLSHGRLIPAIRRRLSSASR